MGAKSPSLSSNYYIKLVTVIHSAGVGRSGTLIAIDMLLQGIQANRDIDIFGTVLNLREQRPNMVQTEVKNKKLDYTCKYKLNNNRFQKQYAYIHRCLNDVIKNPLKEAGKLNWKFYSIKCNVVTFAEPTKPSENIYENVEFLKGSS